MSARVKDSAQDRPDAGRPARREKDPHQRGRKVAPALVEDGLRAQVIVKEGDPDDPGHVEAEDNHDQAADLRQPGAQVVQQSAQEGDRDAQDHKDDAETDHESQTVADRLPARSARHLPVSEAASERPLRYPM